MNKPTKPILFDSCNRQKEYDLARIGLVTEAFNFNNVCIKMVLKMLNDSESIELSKIQCLRSAIDDLHEEAERQAFIINESGVGDLYRETPEWKRFVDVGLEEFKNYMKLVERMHEESFGDNQKE